MRYIKRQDAFSRMTNERYEPDTSMYCAICGGGICWPGEAVDFDEKGEICHSECLEKQRKSLELRRRAMAEKGEDEQRKAMEAQSKA